MVNRLTLDDPRPILLLVAPDEDDRRLIGGLLADARTVVRCVGDGPAAAAAVAEHRPDIVVVEARLAAKALVERLHEEDPLVQVVVLGDPGGAVAVAAARRLGAVDHLPKATLEADTLERTIRYASDHRRIVERLQHEALHDALTGLPNRTLFLDRVAQGLRSARRRGERSGVAVLFLDLDRFKVVNDSLGHEAGDRLLQAVAGRLEAALRPGDTVARMGGDEFTVLLEDVADAREATVVAERMLGALAEPFDVAGRALFASASIGITLGAPDAEPEELVRHADVAMYRAKAEGSARRVVFDAEMHRHVVARLELESRLRRAIDEGTLDVLFQPVFHASTGTIAGFEALCRWEVEPHEFVTLAEETGLIVPLGYLVLEAAARAAARWQTWVSVNLTARQLADPGLAGAIERALAAAGARPGDLRLEVTESALAQDPEGARRTLADLRARPGVRAHLDDFGAGGSSLRLLQGFPGEVLKIDRGLVTAMLADPASHQIVSAMAGLAHHLGMVVVAEGVESAAHLEEARQLGCELVQGFHLSPPLCAAAATERLGREPAAGTSPAAWMEPLPG